MIKIENEDDIGDEQMNTNEHENENEKMEMASLNANE